MGFAPEGVAKLVNLFTALQANMMQETLCFGFFVFNGVIQMKKCELNTKHLCLAQFYQTLSVLINNINI
jgi:hypothetical protein